MSGHIAGQKMKLLHLGSPCHQLRPFEYTGVVQGADLDEHSRRRALRTGCEMDPASFAEMSRRRAQTITLVEGTGRAFGELEFLRGNRNEKIAGSA